MHLNIFKKKANQEKKELSMREKKHQANLRKNSGLHFQIGLIVTLFAIFGVFQLKFEKKEYVADVLTLTKDPVEVDKYVDYVIEEDIPKEVIKEPQQKQPRPEDITKIKEIDNEEKKLIETVINPEKPTVVKDGPIDFSDQEEIPDEIDPIRPVSLVQFLPVFPGCEKFTDKKKQMECFSKKIAKHINKKFDADIAAENGITGKQRINVAFVINDKGEVVDVQARASHPALQKEAMKAVNSLPKMKPAKQGYDNVSVSYALPISFMVSE